MHRKSIDSPAHIYLLCASFFFTVLSKLLVGYNVVVLLHHSLNPLPAIYDEFPLDGEEVALKTTTWFEECFLQKKTKKIYLMYMRCAHISFLFYYLTSATGGDWNRQGEKRESAAI